MFGCLLPDNEILLNGVQKIPHICVKPPLARVDLCLRDYTLTYFKKALQDSFFYNFPPPSFRNKSTTNCLILRIYQNNSRVNELDPMPVN